MLEAARKLNAMIDRRSKQHFVLLLVPMLLVALLEMISLGMIIPVIQVVLFDGEGGKMAEILEQILPVREAGGKGMLVTIFFCAVFAVKSVLLFGMIFLVNRTVYWEVTRYTADLFNLYLKRPVLFHLDRNNAEILRNLTAGASLTFEAIRHVLLILLEALLMIAAILLLCLVEPLITFALAAILLTIAFVFYRFVSPIFRTWGEKQQSLEGAQIKWIVQAFSSIRDTKMFNTYSFLKSGLREIVQQRARYTTYSMSALHIPRLFLETVVIVGFMLLVMMLTGSNMPREEIVATLGVFGMAAIRILPSLNRILSSAAELRQRSAYIDTLHTDWMDGYTNSELNLEADGESRLSFKKELRLSNVSFQYPNTDGPALQGIDLTVRRGQSIGFVGPSGGGKSTLIDLILGLLQPNSGRIEADGKSILDGLGDWRSRIGFVPQQIYLLDDTIRRNIAFGIRDEDINEEKIGDAVGLASLRPLVSQLPDGLDTVVGEQGTRLSGGQRQRIAIARAVYRNPDILVLDEATSALDSVSESEITSALESAARDRTLLVIAHRLATIKNCDRVVFVRDGRIAAEGTFDDLMARNEEFAEFASSAPSPHLLEH